MITTKKLVNVSIRDLESDYRFDYGKYRILYEQLGHAIKGKIGDRLNEFTKSFISRLLSLGLDKESILPFHYLSEERPYDIIKDVVFMHFADRLKKYIKEIKDPDKRGVALSLLEEYDELLEFSKSGLLIKHFSKIFNTVKEYVNKISDNFILIPNKEYFPKEPLVGKGGDQIEIFDVNRFEDKLASLIDSPSKKERELIQKFNGVWDKSYGDLGELEIRKFREEIFAIFDTGFTALPIENQGLGIQDLFLYIAHMILFDSAIIAIEEPEGGLSSENQRTLHNIIEDVYAGSAKQIFISSHSKEFETLGSYIIELGKDGSRVISRKEEEKEYEEKIGGILVNRRLEQEKEQYEALLREVTEREITLDILNYISKLGAEEKVDAQKISNELGYKKEKVEEVLSNILMKKTK